MSDKEIYESIFKRIRGYGERSFSSGKFFFTWEAMGKGSYKATFARAYEKYGILNLFKRLVFCVAMTLDEDKKSINYETLVELPGGWREKIYRELNRA